MTAALRCVLAAIAVFVVGWGLLLAADAGGWIRFSAALAVCAVAAIVLPKELRDPHDT